MCFVTADWPLIGGTFTTRGVHVLWPKRLTELLGEGAAGTVKPRGVVFGGCGVILGSVRR
jgi:hypothetical protein